MYVCLPVCGFDFLHKLLPRNVLRSIQLLIDCLQLYPRMPPNSLPPVANVRACLYVLAVVFQLCMPQTEQLWSRTIVLLFNSPWFSPHWSCQASFLAFTSLCIASNLIALLSAVDGHRPCTAIGQADMAFCRLLPLVQPLMAEQSFELCPPHHAPCSVCAPAFLTLPCMHVNSFLLCGHNISGGFLF